MKTEAYTASLLARGVDKAAIQEKIQAVQAFDTWLLQHHVPWDAAAGKEVRQYAEHLINTGSNTVETYDALAAYAYWLGLRSLYVALVEVTDCHNGMAVLRDTIEKQHGVQVRDKIFTDPLPPLGASEMQRFTYTKAVNARMNALLSKEEVRAAWYQVQHGISREFWQTYDGDQRKRYAACKTPEALVTRLLEDRNALLKRMHDENMLWFTQEITDDAYRYLLSHPYLRLGTHHGRKGVIVTKVPYMADRVLNETDDNLKRYYTCHCPLVREAILRGETLTADVCYCSLGHASHYLAGIGLENLQGEVLESAVKGDARCRFIFYLPQQD